MLFVQVFINRLLVSSKIRIQSVMNSLVVVFLFMRLNISLGLSSSIDLITGINDWNFFSASTVPISRGLPTTRLLGLSIAVVLRLIHVRRLVHGLFLRNLWCVPSQYWRFSSSNVIVVYYCQPWFLT